MLVYCYALKHVKLFNLRLCFFFNLISLYISLNEQCRFTMSSLTFAGCLESNQPCDLLFTRVFPMDYVHLGSWTLRSGWR